MGRYPLNEEKRKERVERDANDVPFFIRVPYWVSELIRMKAFAERRTLSATVRIVVEDWAIEITKRIANEKDKREKKQG